jgi:hypothetical protein
MSGGFDGFNNSLTMTYFHTGTRTIIGAKSFHCPVRDGKEWDQLAMVVRHNWLPSCVCGTAKRIHRVFNQLFLIAANVMALGHDGIRHLH